MKIKLSVGYGLAFLCMLFLVHELHDQAHFITGRLFCGCWGTKYFNSWSFCTDCKPGIGEQVITWLDGPMINYIVIMVAWNWMQAGHSAEKKSLGFSLLFAAQPFIRLWAAAHGGGDETLAIRMLIQKPPGNDHHLPAILGLLLVLIFTAPALFRAFRLMKNRTEQFLIFPVFLILPVFIDQWILIDWLNNIQFTGWAAREILPGTPMLLTAWTLLLLVIVIFNWNHLRRLLLPPR